VENFMMRKCNSLNELLRFSDFLNPEARRGIRRAVAANVQQVVRSEWPALGERRRDKSAEQAFSELLDAILRTAPASAEEGVVHQRLIDIAREAGQHRDERLTKSLTQIPATLIHLVHTLRPRWRCSCSSIRSTIGLRACAAFCWWQSSFFSRTW
jgi:hypothetical protein